MTTTQLVSKIESLPIQFKKEAEKFVESLLEKAQRESKEKQPLFGCAKGEFKISDDFNDPLDDFNDYMK